MARVTRLYMEYSDCVKIVSRQYGEIVEIVWRVYTDSLKCFRLCIECPHF